jgi:hypothetical protein
MSAETGGGAFVPKTTGYEGSLIKSLLNGSPLELLPEETQVDGKIWVHVKSPDGFDGWVLQSVLITATPIPSNTPTLSPTAPG